MRLRLAPPSGEGMVEAVSQGLGVEWYGLSREVREVDRAREAGEVVVLVRSREMSRCGQAKAGGRGISGRSTVA